MSGSQRLPVDLNRGFRIALEVMGGTRKPYIIYELLDGPRRPSELMEYGVVEKQVIDPVCNHPQSYFQLLSENY